MTDGLFVSSPSSSLFSIVIRHLKKVKELAPDERQNTTLALQPSRASKPMNMAVADTKSIYFSPRPLFIDSPP